MRRLMTLFLLMAGGSAGLADIVNAQALTVAQGTIVNFFADPSDVVVEMNTPGSLRIELFPHPADCDQLPRNDSGCTDGLFRRQDHDVLRAILHWQPQHREPRVRRQSALSSGFDFEHPARCRTPSVRQRDTPDHKRSAQRTNF
jgi:hypothetical protein